MVCFGCVIVETSTKMTANNNNYYYYNVSFRYIIVNTLHIGNNNYYCIVPMQTLPYTT